MRDFWQLFVLLWLSNMFAQALAFQLGTHSSLAGIVGTKRRNHRQQTLLHAAASSTAIDDYCQLVQKAIDDDQFVSLYLKGPSKKKANKDELRGCLAQVQGRLVELAPKKKKKKKLANEPPEILLQTTFKYHGATDVAKNWQLTQVGATLQDLIKQTAENDDANDYKSEWGTWHDSGTPLGLEACTLVTVAQTMELNLKTKKVRTRRTKTEQEEVITKHDRTKQVPVSQEAPFWQAIGLTKKPAKRRQCQKFVEIVANLIQKKIATTASSISTVDMGCGRGYLTFALHHYLQETYSSTGDESATTIQTRGIDMRPKLVAEMNEIASTLDGMAPGLMFETGTIESFLAASESDDSSDSGNDLQVLIALHACDTATDDALWTGIQSNADILVVAPCCHKQVRSQLDRVVTSHPLQDVLRHGIYRERMAETVTDAMRALLLEIAHYQVQVFEFIGGEHTAKNVMITAVRLPRKRSEKELNELRKRLVDLAQLHGIRAQTLAQWMAEDLGAEIRSDPLSLSAKAMPPL